MEFIKKKGKLDCPAFCNYGSAIQREFLYETYFEFEGFMMYFGRYNTDSSRCKRLVESSTMATAISPNDVCPKATIEDYYDRLIQKIQISPYASFSEVVDNFLCNNNVNSELWLKSLLII